MEAEQASMDAAYEAKLDNMCADAAAKVAAELRAAMKGFGTNEDRMIEAIAGVYPISFS